MGYKSQALARFLFASMSLAVFSSASAVNPPPSATSKRIASNFAGLPLSFEANLGQADEPIQFIARLGRGFLFLAEDGATLVEGDLRLRIGLAGALQPISLEPSGLLAWKSHYFIGKHPDGWHTNLPQYSYVSYRQVYRGIDLVFHQSQGQLEFDFVVAPGADPKVIRLQFQGVEGLDLDAQGNLLLKAEAGNVEFQKPVVFQEENGSRIAVDGGFSLEDDGQVGFWLGAYDTARTLTIDPIIGYSTFLGGGESDQAFGVAVDSSGSAYVIGRTSSADFPTTTGAFDETQPGGVSDVFVVKLNPSGDGLEYATFLGGERAGGELGFAIAVDDQGSAFVAGLTNSGDFPTTEGAFNPVPDGGAFVSKLSPDGSALEYSTYLGGNSLSVAHGIAIDAEGNAYVTGQAAGDDFPSTAGSFQPANPSGDRDAFIVKLNPQGSALVYASFLGGTTREAGYDVAVDAEGNAYIAGYTNSDDFPSTAGAFQTALNGNADAFVVKVNPAGSALVYSSLLGGSGGAIGDRAFGIDLDSSGSAYLTGLTGSLDFPVTEGALDSSRGRNNDDSFVTKFSPDGSALVYSTYLGGDNTDRGAGIFVDGDGNAYIAGFTASGDFPLQGAIQGDGPATDAFVCKLNPSGSGLLFSTYLSGDDSDVIGDTGGNPDGNPIAVDSNGSIYVAGWTESADFPADAFQTVQAGNRDAFVVKISEVETQDLIFAHFGDGQGLVSEIVLVNSSTVSSASGSVAFTKDDGTPFLVGIVNGAATSTDRAAAKGANPPQSSIDFDLPPLGSVVVSTDGAKAAAEAGAAVATFNGKVGGVIRFTISGIGVAGVGVSRPLNHFGMPVRRKQGGINTGVAIYNPEDGPINLSMTLRDPQGIAIPNGQASLPEDVPSHGHLAKFIDELFPAADLADFQGVLEVTVNDGKSVAATVLELDVALLLFTTLPVIPLG